MASTLCPECRNDLPDTAPFPAWCPNCNWNLDPVIQMVEWTGGPIERRLAKLRRHFAEKQFEAMLDRPAGSDRARFGLANVLGWTLATIVNLFPLILLIIGVWLAAANWPAAWGVIWGGLLVLIGIGLAVPHRRWQPRGVLDRAEAPELHSLADEVADRLGTKRVGRLIVSSEFNAGYVDGGLFRRPSLIVGLPLWTVLSAQERVALLSHEFAHGSNRDGVRHGFMGRAVGTVASVANATAPGSDSLNAIILAPLLAPISGAFGGLYFLIVSLMWQRSQEAEFLADRQGAVIAGSVASIGTLQKQAYWRYIMAVLDPIAYARDGNDGNFFPAFRAFTAAIPPLERDRLRRLQEHETFEKNADHPPAWARLKFIEREMMTPALVVSAERMAAIDAETVKLERRLTGVLLADNYPGHF